MKFALILFFYAGLGENTVSMQKVEGFTSLVACEKAGNLFMNNNVGGPSYSQRFVCLPVE